MLEFDVEVVKSLEQAVPALASSTVASALRDSFGVCTQSWGESEKPVTLLVFDPDLRAHPELANLGLSLKIEPLRDGVSTGEKRLAVHRYDRFLAGNSLHECADQLFAFQRLDQVPAPQPDAAETARWTVRITGGNRGVLRLWHAKAYWTGSIDISLPDLIEREAQRTAGKPKRIFAWMP